MESKLVCMHMFTCVDVEVRCLLVGVKSLPLHVARLDGTCLLSTAPSREPCFELWSADAHRTHLYIRCELTLLWLYIVWLLKVSDALPLTLCGLSSLNAIAYMVDLLWSFFICLTNSAMMGKVLHTAYVFKCHPANVWFSLDGVRSLTFTVHIKCVVAYHLHFPWTPCNLFSFILFFIFCVPQEFN